MKRSYPFHETTNDEPQNKKSLINQVLQTKNKIINKYRSKVFRLNNKVSNLEKTVNDLCKMNYISPESRKTLQVDCFVFIYFSCIVSCLLDC